ncbi:hypothetical protein P9139_03680 [Curtobacterium flaccumfaciens]|nr:hypothetical protein P9139_03680 [Curtobacterium flaccumfaciens]
MSVADHEPSSSTSASASVSLPSLMTKCAPGCPVPSRSIVRAMPSTIASISGGRRISTEACTSIAFPLTCEVTRRTRSPDRTRTSADQVPEAVDSVQVVSTPSPVMPMLPPIGPVPINRTMPRPWLIDFTPAVKSAVGLARRCSGAATAPTVPDTRTTGVKATASAATQAAVRRMRGGRTWCDMVTGAPH